MAYVDAAPQASSIPRERRVGFLPWLKHLIVGERDPIQAQLHEVERQGKGMARLMHIAGYLMLVLFSIGSAIGICGSIIQEIATGGQLLTWHSAVLEVVVLVSLMLVFCMDLADIYAAFMIRLLATRRAPKRAYTLHIIVIAIATILEGATFILMSYTYDNVVGWLLAGLVIARGVFAPLFAIYLNMARPIPVGVADIAYHSFLAAGQGVVRDTIVIANDSNASLADKAELMSASAYVSNHEQETLDRIIAASKKREEVARRIPAIAAPEPRNRVYAASYVAPEPQLQQHHADVIAHNQRHDYDIPVDPWGIEDDDPGVTGVFSEEELAAEYTGPTTAPRSRAKSANNSAPKPSTKRASQAISEGMVRSHKERKAEGRERRQRTIEADVHAVLDEWYAAGSAKGLTDGKLADKVFKLGHLTVRPSENNVSRYRSKWEIQRKREALATATAAEPQPELALEGALP